MNNVIRTIIVNSSQTYTYAGTGASGVSNGGGSVGATFSNPLDVCYSTFDQYVYIAGSYQIIDQIRQR
jgi:hypothetical protein